MRRFFGIFFIPILALVLSSCAVTIGLEGNNKDVSPYDFGLQTAKTGEDRYHAILKAHQAAVKAGVNVDYSGIDTLRLEIPKKTSSIPLTKHNDFKGCVFIIKNTSGNCWLFEKKVKGIPLEVDKRSIDAGMFTSYDSLKTGRCLLLIEDEKPWVLNRKGYDYGHQRKDILLIENGKAKNRVIMPYDNEHSSPICVFIRLTNEPLVIKNFSIERDSMCSFVTHIAYVSGFDDVRISNISIHTPESALQNDRGIRVYNCTNVTLENVRIDGTYSQQHHSGYGINLGNVWNFKAKHLYGKANWGIFGNNNVNVARIEDSQINRFDIHCYGKDLSYKNVFFFDRYNSHASVFGTIKYEHCTFTNFVPSQYGGSYNAFVEHEIVLNDCVFNVTSKKNYLCWPMTVTGEVNARSELSKKCLPNVKIKNMTVNMIEGAKDFYLFFIKKTDEVVDAFGGLSQILIKGLTINSTYGASVQTVQLCNRRILTENEVSCNMSRVQVNQQLKNAPFGTGRPTVRLIANMNLKGGKVRLKDVKGISQ